MTFPSLNSGAAKEPKVRIEKTFTYLDTIGRPTVLFEVESVVDEQFGEKFKVFYF